MHAHKPVNTTWGDYRHISSSNPNLVAARMTREEILRRLEMMEFEREFLLELNDAELRRVYANA